MVFWDLHDKKQNINGQTSDVTNVCSSWNFVFENVIYILCTLVVCISLTTMYRPYWKNGYKMPKLWR